jgi:hypothetical protein
MSDQFRSHCRLLRRATLGVSAGLLLLMLMLLFSWVRHLPEVDEAGGRVFLAAVRMVPAACYLWALWAVQSALRDLAAGQVFQPTVALAMRHMGYGVLGGALWNVFAVVNLTRWIVGGTGSFVYFDLSGIVLGVVGAALILLAQLVDQARALQTELDEIL